MSFGGRFDTHLSIHPRQVRRFIIYLIINRLSLCVSLCRRPEIYFIFQISRLYIDRFSILAMVPLCAAISLTHHFSFPPFIIRMYIAEAINAIISIGFTFVEAPLPVDHYFPNIFIYVFIQDVFDRKKV